MIFMNEKKAVLRFCIMNDKKRILILLKILDQIKQKNEEASSGIERSISTICKEEGILYLLLYLLFVFIFLYFVFLMLH